MPNHGVLNAQIRHAHGKHAVANTNATLSSPNNSATSRPISPARVEDIFAQLWSFISAAGNADAVVFDTETTGSGSNMHIIEIGAVLISDHTPIFQYDQLLRPPAGTPLTSSALTGITEADLVDQPDAGFIIPPFLTAIRPLLLIGHNVSYDIRALNIEGSSLGCRELSNESRDTLLLARQVFPNAPSRTLQEVMRLLGIDEIEQHRAVSDAMQTWECWKRMSSMDSPVILDDKQIEQAAQRSKAVKRRNTSQYMASMYLSNQDTTPANAKPQSHNPVIESYGNGMPVRCDPNLQNILARYGYDAWLWVEVTHGILQTGKNAGKPTLVVSLDGTVIGHTTALQASRNAQLVPAEGAVMIAHIPNSSQDITNGTYGLKVQMPDAS